MDTQTDDWSSDIQLEGSKRHQAYNEVTGPHHQQLGVQKVDWRLN